MEDQAVLLTGLIENHVTVYIQHVLYLYRFLPWWSTPWLHTLWRFCWALTNTKEVFSKNCNTANWTTTAIENLNVSISVTTCPNRDLWFMESFMKASVDWVYVWLTCDLSYRGTKQFWDEIHKFACVNVQLNVSSWILGQLQKEVNIYLLQKLCRGVSLEPGTKPSDFSLLSSGWSYGSILSPFLYLCFHILYAHCVKWGLSYDVVQQSVCFASLDSDQPEERVKELVDLFTPLWLLGHMHAEWGLLSIIVHEFKKSTSTLDELQPALLSNSWSLSASNTIYCMTTAFRRQRSLGL